jgi:glycosyltransferase involved in cell wall biosynthesis
MQDYVSIIVCHYNQVDDFGGLRAPEGDRGDFLRQTMESLIKNTDYPAEIVVVDNGGRGDSTDYLVSLARGGKINTLIRNKENMNFGWAWNQGARLATGSFLCFTCNDLLFEDRWLSQTIEPLLKYPDKKLIASPLCTPDKDAEKFYRGELDGYRLNALAGSNCMIMRKSVYEDVGGFSTHRIAGTHWHFKMKDMGYVVVLPPKNLAHHLGERGGTDYRKDITVKKTLLDNSIVDFSCKKF